MIRNLLLGFLTLFVVFVAYLVLHLGLFKPVEIGVEKRGPMILLFSQFTGPYHQILPTIEKAEAWTRDHKLECPKTFGEYLDDPRLIDEDRLRSHGGCLLTAPLTTVPPDFQYQVRPERTYVVAKFLGSPAIGPYKVYPKVQTFIEEQRLKAAAPVIEIYTISNDKMITEYLFAVDNAK